MNFEINESINPLTDCEDFDSKVGLSRALRERVVLEFGESLTDEVVCPVCQGILVDPKACFNCGQCYCHECVELLIENHERCICGIEVFYQEPHKIIRRILGRYRFRCGYSTTGCPELLAYESILDHEDRCSFKPVRCINEFCETQLTKRELEAHILICGYKRVDCSYCALTFLKCDIEFHSANCERRPTYCVGCAKALPFGELIAHQGLCEDLKETCSGCTQQLTKREMRTHSAVSCIAQQFNNTAKGFAKEVDSIRSITKDLGRRLDEQKGRWSIRCVVCDKFACEVSQRCCSGCGKSLCIPCSRKAMKNCKGCREMNCARCIGNSEVCQTCIKRRRGKNEVGRVVKNAVPC